MCKSATVKKSAALEASPPKTALIWMGVLNRFGTWNLHHFLETGESIKASSYTGNSITREREKYRWCCLELLFSKGPGILDKNHFRFKTAGYSHAGNLDVCPLQDQSRQGENLLLVCPQKNSTSRGCLVLLLRQVDSVHTLFYGNFEIQMV